MLRLFLPGAILLAGSVDFARRGVAAEGGVDRAAGGDDVGDEDADVEGTGKQQAAGEAAAGDRGEDLRGLTGVRQLQAAQALR